MRIFIQFKFIIILKDLRIDSSIFNYPIIIIFLYFKNLMNYINNQYQLIKKVSAGSYGIVYEGENVINKT